MESIWTKTTTRPTFPVLDHELSTDVLVVGGGMAGLLTAYALKQAGVDCALVERERICGGITENTTAKITFQHGLIYDRLMRIFGLEGARAYLEANRGALLDYKMLCRRMDCDFEEADSVVYSLNNQKKIEDEVAAYQKLGFFARYLPECSLPFPIAGAVQVEKQAHFHPLKFAFALSRELRIFEKTKLLAFKKEGVLTNRGLIKAKKVVVTTHFPLLNKHGFYFLKLYQQRSYVLALKNATLAQGMYIDGSGEGLSFRRYGDLLLLGGGGHRTGKKGGGWQALLDFAAHYPSAKEVCRFATQDCMSLDGIPYIGQYSSRTPNLYVATGFNKWGMTSSMVASHIFTDLILGRENAYAALFSPSRSILHPQLAKNAFESTVGLLTPTVPRCSHLGCALKYNKQEHSWDCPCHGSRFSKDGALIDNPATDDKRGMGEEDD